MGGKSSTFRRAQPEAPIATTHQNRHERTGQMGKAWCPFQPRLRQNIRCDAMQRGACQDDIGAGNPVMAVGNDKIEPGWRQAWILYLYDTRALPPQRRANRPAASPDADDGMLAVIIGQAKRFHSA